MSDNIIARLSGFAVVSRLERNSVDSALAKINRGVKYDGNIIPKGFGFSMEGKKIRKALDTESLLELLNKDKVVCKIGRTTGYTEGVISAIALANVPVKTSIGNVVFDDVIEVTWKSSREPFSKPGDSGSLVFTKNGAVAVGLHFAGGVKRANRGKTIGVSYSCDLLAILEAHEASLLD